MLVNGLDLTDEQKAAFDELSKVFTEVHMYRGDDELISSCNDEYLYDPEDIIMTDGCMCIENIVDDDCTEARLAVRGASYIIVYDITTNCIDLSVELPKIISSKASIMEAYNRLLVNLKDMKYYMKEWRSDVADNPYVGGDVMYTSLPPNEIHRKDITTPGPKTPKAYDAYQAWLKSLEEE